MPAVATMPLHPSARRRLWQWGAALGLAALAGGAALLEGKMFWSEYRCLLPADRHPKPISVTRAEAAPEALTYQTDHGSIAAWFARGTRPSGVLLIHGSSGNRSDLSAEFRILSDAGFHVLALDLPGHGESSGEVDYGEATDQAIARGLEVLRNRAETRAVGIYGFSLGGYLALQAGLADPEVRAVAVAGTPGDIRAHLCVEYPRQCRISVSPAVWALQLRGLDADRNPPLPRLHELKAKLLVLQGAMDPIVPETLSRDVYRAAPPGSRLLVIPNAGHGHYEQSAPALFTAELTGFFEHQLAQPGASDVP